MRHRPKSRGCLVVLLGVPLLLAMALALYVLSIGPAARLVEHDHLSVATWRSVYKPILGQCIQHPAICNMVTWYGGVCGADETWFYIYVHIWGGGSDHYQSPDYYTAP